MQVRRFLRLLVFIVLALILGYLLLYFPEGKRLVSVLTERYGGQVQPTPEVVLTQERLIEQINKYRADNNLTILRENEKLAKAAEARLAVVLVQSDFEGEITGLTWENALRNNSYEFQKLGSLFALDVSGGEDLLEGWQKDEQTALVLQEKTFTEIGAAVRRNEDGWQVVVVLARPAKVVKSTTVEWGGPELWAAVNRRREELGVSPLRRQEELCTIASIRLNQLLELGKLDGHAGFEPTITRPDLAWIRQKYNLSEFLVSGYATPESAVAAWEHTLGHKDLLAGGQYVWGCIYAQNMVGVAITAY